MFRKLAFESLLVKALRELNGQSLAGALPLV
jgi:hypothetical protein